MVSELNANVHEKRFENYPEIDLSVFLFKKNTINQSVGSRNYQNGHNENIINT